MKPYISVVIKPTLFCNESCSHCYHTPDERVRGEMSLETLDRLMGMVASEYQAVWFIWHGGEPLLLGTDFYRRAMALQKKYAAGKRIENTIQTNGTLVTEEWCGLFTENNFLVGISLDGPQDIHDAFRLTKGGRPTFEKVMSAISMFRKTGVEFNTLSVVSSLCGKRGGEIYRFLRDKARSRYMQFLPAVEHVADRPGYHRPVIVPPETEGAYPAPRPW